MPIYKNNSDIKQKVSGIIFDAGEQKEVDCYLYDDDLELINEAPVPFVITDSGLLQLSVDEVEIISLNNTEDCILDVIVQATTGGIKLYHNSTENLPIEFEGIYQDRISSKYLNKIIIVGTLDNTKVNYFIKKIG